MPELIPLPEQPEGVPWPTFEWPEAPPPDGVDRVALDELLDATFSEPQPATTARTNEMLVVHRGRIVAERYADGNGPGDTQPSWSMAKSILHAAVGVAGARWAASTYRSQRRCPNGRSPATHAEQSRSTRSST